MKKVLAIFLVLVMICSFAACGSKKTESGDSSKGDGRNPAIVAYMEKNSDELIKSMEESFAGSSGMTCTSSWEVDGNGIILTIKINEMDDLGDDAKEQMQQVFDSMDSVFETALEALKTEIPEVESLTMLICEKDGDTIATIKADGSKDTGKDTGKEPVIDSNKDDGRNPAIVAYMEKNSDMLIKSMEESFAGSSGMTCKSSWEVEGDGIILTIKINDLEDLDDEMKDMMQEAYDSMDSVFETALEALQTEIPEVESLTMLICEKDGDIIATIKADGSKETGSIGEAGTYNLVSMTMEDTTLNAEDLAAIGMDSKIYVTLNGDGTGEMCIDAEIMEICYDGSKLWPVDEPDEPVSYTLIGNTLTMSEDGTTMVFEK